MQVPAAVVIGVLLVATLSGCAGDAPLRRTLAAGALALQSVVQGLDEPVFVAGFPDGSGRLAVVEQTGRVLLVRAGAMDGVLLDVRDKVRAGGERGLLGLAFDPDFAANGFLFVDYTDSRGDTVVERYTVPEGMARADERSAFRVLHVIQPQSNHNGGMVAFGPDGYLYVGMGDGGGGGDPDNRAQDTHDLLGKLLRIDVAVPPHAGNGLALDATYRPLPYAIPADNPFVDGSDGAPEVWAFGLRNPWRFSFDHDTGDLWIGDVGQDQWEEIDMEPAGSGGGRNYGWSAWEGTHRYDATRQARGAVAPVAEYSHAGGSCSVTGGYVYRGSALPALKGTYLFADYCSGRLWSLAAGVAEVVLETGLAVASFGEDGAGNLYVVDHGGAIYRIVAAG